MSVQIIDDTRGVTLAAASTLEKDLGFYGKNTIEAAQKIGATIAERREQRRASTRPSSIVAGSCITVGVKALAGCRA